MAAKTPHYLLFSEATDRTAVAANPQLDPCSASDESDGPSKIWHFVLRTSEGETSLDVADLERGASEERLELLAVVRGLESLDQPSKVTLVTTSSSIRRGLRFGLDHWRQNRWQWERFGKMAPIKNADLWQRIDRAMSFHDLECRVLRFDRPADDLSRPVSSPAAAPARRASGTAAVSRRPRPEYRDPSPQLLGFGRLLRRLFGWCGLCRSEPSLVIAAH